MGEKERREHLPRRRRVRRWLARRGWAYDPAVEVDPRLEDDNAIKQGRARANGISNRA